MGEKLTLRYDRVGDILYIDKVQPYREQDSDEIGDEIVARLNPDTGEVENVEILFFSKRLEKGEVVMELPISGSLHLSP
jgi:uncharacterized protein YuzE